MSVIIKNMEMPRNCLGCKFYKQSAPYEIPCCMFGGYVRNPYIREEFCPLVENKDIEKEELLEKLENRTNEACLYAELLVKYGILDELTK